MGVGVYHGVGDELPDGSRFPVEVLQALNQNLGWGVGRGISG